MPSNNQPETGGAQGPPNLKSATRIPPPLLEVVVVGNGPSTYQRGLGPKIDQFENVVRPVNWGNFKSGIYYKQEAKDFGRRTTYLLTSYRTMADTINQGTQPEKEVWVFGRLGVIGDREEWHIINRRLSDFNVAVCRECDTWLQRFIEMGVRPSGYADDHPMPSRGTLGMLIAAHRLRPKQIYHVGMDLVFGDLDFSHGHHWEMERKLLDEVQEFYEVQLVPLTRKT